MHCMKGTVLTEHPHNSMHCQPILSECQYKVVMCISMFLIFISSSTVQPTDNGQVGDGQFV